MVKKGKKKARDTRSDSNQSQMKDLQLDPRGDGMYSGTFRWLESKQFPRLPPPSNNTSINLAHGWEGYLRSRATAAIDMVQVAKTDPSCLDALSFPVTFMHVASILRLLDGADDSHIVILGATRKAEQRVWCITDYWSEIALFYASKKITLWFVGPEADESCSTRVGDHPTIVAKHINGTFQDFIKHPEATHCSSANTVLIGYNTGFGNFVESGRFELLFSWLKDLYAIADSGFPAIFTCANDYADMNGEFAVQSRVIGANMLLLPQQNPFSMASHLHEEGKQDTAWSRGNSFLYAIRGRDTSRRITLKDGDVPTLQARLDAPLDLHLQDSLGRHFYKGMVLSKEQASRCKALNGSATSTTSDIATASQQPTSLKTPTLQILPGSQDKKVILLLHIPDADASSRIAVDVSDATLSLLIPTKYALRAQLPFQVENNAPVHAELVPPYLKIVCERK